MSPREILKKIISEQGSCMWVNNRTVTVCVHCPLSAPVSCLYNVSKMVGGITDIHFCMAAKKTLDALDVENILLGDDNEHQ